MIEAKKIQYEYGHPVMIEDMILLSNGNIASCSDDKKIKIWYTVNGSFKCLHTFEGH